MKNIILSIIVLLLVTISGCSNNALRENEKIKKEDYIDSAGIFTSICMGTKKELTPRLVVL